MGACTAPGNLTIITELMPKGSVADLLRDKNVKLSFKQRMNFARDAGKHSTFCYFVEYCIFEYVILYQQRWE